MGSSLRQGRTFDALDLLSLMGFTGLAAVWLWLVGPPWERLYVAFEGNTFERLYFNVLPIAAMVADPFLTAWTLAWCVLRLRGPRPRRRRLFLQPGMAVGFVALLSWFGGVLVMLRWGMDVHHGTPDPADFGIVLMASSTMFGGFGVAVTWSGAALNGSWRPERSWIDRAGQALGVGWLALGVPSSVLLRILTEPYY